TLSRVRPRHAATAADDRHALLAGLLARLERDARDTREERPRLLAEFNGHFHVLEAASVEMIEADRNYVSIRVGQQTFHARSTLMQAELALRTQPMLRISRSCLVNINYVKEVNRTLRGDFILILAGGATVTSSEGYRAKVKEYLASLRISPTRSSTLAPRRRHRSTRGGGYARRATTAPPVRTALTSSTGIAANGWFPDPYARSFPRPVRRWTTRYGCGGRAPAYSFRPRRCRRA